MGGKHVRSAFARPERDGIVSRFGSGATARSRAKTGDRRETHMGERAEVGIIGGTGLYQMEGFDRGP